MYNQTRLCPIQEPTSATPTLLRVHRSHPRWVDLYLWCARHPFTSLYAAPKLHLPAPVCFIDTTGPPLSLSLHIYVVIHLVRCYHVHLREMGSGIHGVQNVVFPVAWAKFVSKCSHKHAFPPSRAIFEIIMDKIRKTPYLVPRTKHTPFPGYRLTVLRSMGFQTDGAFAKENTFLYMAEPWRY